MSRYARRRDSNHTAVGDYLRAHGFTVLDIADHGDGVPDYVIARRGMSALVEVKNPEKPPSARKLTEKEQAVKDNWDGIYIVALSGEDAVAQFMAHWMAFGRGMD